MYIYIYIYIYFFWRVSAIRLVFHCNQRTGGGDTTCGNTADRPNYS